MNELNANDIADSTATEVVRKKPSAWVEILFLSLFAAAVAAGWRFWADWLSVRDQSFFTFCMIVGLCVAMVRSSREGEVTAMRLWIGSGFYAISAIALALSFGSGSAIASVFALGFAILGWGLIRFAGESPQHAIGLGLVCLLPLAISNLVSTEWLDWLESTAVAFTSRLADTFGMSHVREESRILFEKGIADRFSCQGSWDSVIAFLGIALACILGFRRNFIPAIATLLGTVAIWIALRGCVWVTLVYLGSQNETWVAWSPGLELVALGLGALFIVNWDGFWGSIFEPIPFEYINADFPLVAFLWNWFCSLPKLAVRVPHRETDFGPTEEDF